MDEFTCWTCGYVTASWVGANRHEDRNPGHVVQCTGSVDDQVPAAGADHGVTPGPRRDDL